MAAIKKLYVHVDRWNQHTQAISVPGMTLWCAHRPLRGYVTWEGTNVGWGVHYAAAYPHDEQYDSFVESNTRDDAREVQVVSNADVLVLAGQKCHAAGSEYGLDVYVGELGAEGAREFAIRWELPWSETDLSADAVIARLMGGAA